MPRMKKLNFKTSVFLLLLFVVIFSLKLEVSLFPKASSETKSNRSNSNLVATHPSLSKIDNSKKIKTNEIEDEEKYPRKRNGENGDLNKKTRTDIFVYCELDKLNLNIPLNGVIKIFGGIAPEFLNDDGENLYAWVYSSTCPPDTYSIVNARKNKGDSSWEIVSVMDCRDVTLGDLSVHSGMQFEIDSIDNKKENEFYFAINGPGYFQLLCKNNQYYITRLGTFYRQPSGSLMDSNGCRLVNDHKKPITVAKDDKLSQKRFNCFKLSNQCIRIIDPVSPAVREYEYVDPFYLWVDIDENADSDVMAYGQVLENAIEVLDTPDRGPTGILSWKSVAALPDVINCNSNRDQTSTNF